MNKVVSIVLSQTCKTIQSGSNFSSYDDIYHNPLTSKPTHNLKLQVMDLRIETKQNRRFRDKQENETKGNQNKYAINDSRQNFKFLSIELRQNRYKIQKWITETKTYFKKPKDQTTMYKKRQVIQDTMCSPSSPMQNGTSLNQPQ